MEKMDSEKKCEHIKCYSNAMIATNPPKKQWICELCGEEGTETIGKHGVVVGRYEELQAKKKAGGFKDR